MCLSLKTNEGSKLTIMKRLAIGIDIGGTNTVFGLVDSKGEMFGERSISTRGYVDFDQYITALHQNIEALHNQVSIEYRLVGIGIGAPCANHFKGTIDHAPNLSWKGILPLAESLKKYYPNTPILITNDANAAAIGEMIYGGAKGMKDFIVVTLGTGLGSGFVANGELIYGFDSFAGELGHVKVADPLTGRQCGCGKRGCLETYASASGIKRTIFKLVADNVCNSEFRDISFNDLKAEMITQAAFRGDPIAIEAFEYTGKHLGRALANTWSITSPEAIFLFGGLAKAGKYLIEPTKKYMEESILQNFKDNIQLLPSAIDDKNAAILGASALVWQNLAAEQNKK